MNEELLNSKELGEKLRRGKTWIAALKKEYQFQFGTRTTLTHCLNWLEKHPDFRCTHHALLLLILNFC